MVSRLTAALHRETSNDKHLIPFLMTGDPDLETTVNLVLRLADAGASAVELGVPFSDPVADGVVIQRAAERALSRGVTVADALAVVARVREQSRVPIVLFSYFNPLLQFGLERFALAAREAGADGVLVTDLTPESAADFKEKLDAQHLDLIFLVTPTTTDRRLGMIAQQASGFLYAVSRTGVTGARSEMSDDAAALVARVRIVSDLPVAVGFGVSTNEHVAEICRYADAAVVGSALVAEVERLTAEVNSERIAEQVGDFARALMV